NLLRGYTRGDIDGGGATIQSAEVAGQILPVHVETEAMVLVGLVLLRGRTDHWRHRGAFTDDVQGHALPNLALGVAIDQDGNVAMGVHVDESRTNGQSPGIDSAFGRAGLEVANGSYAPVLNAEIGIKAK